MSAPSATDLRARLRGAAAGGRASVSDGAGIAGAASVQEAERRVRVTVDLTPEAHKALRLFAIEAETDASATIRALLELLHEDESVCARVTARVRRARRAAR